MKPIYMTNAKKRCMYCKGREVATMYPDKPIETNLESVGNGLHKCKDVQECEQNIVSENSQLNVSIDERGNKVIKYEKNGKVIMEIREEKSDDF